ncbi:MAG: four helix bundle protein [Bacteroidetes bacterium]|nr:four helix bundle protein [Bacteroidota bacterium]
MIIKRFEYLVAWQKAQDLAVDVYKIFNRQKDYGFKDQILQAVVSISNNIAKGFERGTNTEFRRFIRISNGSCSEVRSMLHLAIRLHYLDAESYHKLTSQSSEISRILIGLSKSLIKK